jgi:cytochrome c5
LTDAESMRTVVVLLGALLVGCSDAPDSEGRAPVALDDAVTAKWARSCVLCHVQGEGGAPRVGHPDEWRARLAQGEDVLLMHTIEGYNNMPPLGYCMDCEASDFKALIRFMAAGS